MKTKAAKSQARREFFRRAGFGVGALGAAALGVGGGRAEAATDAGDGKKRKGYRETAHVRKYYELARF